MIRPPDDRAAVRIELEIPAELDERIKHFAENLKGTHTTQPVPKSYVIVAALEEVFLHMNGTPAEARKPRGGKRNTA